MKEENILDLGTEDSLNSSVKFERQHVNSYDIFRLAKRILLACAIIYVMLASVRIFYSGETGNNEGIKEVWEYSKVLLNSIVSLVLGLYFGSKHESKRS